MPLTLHTAALVSAGQMPAVAVYTGKSILRVCPGYRLVLVLKLGADKPGPRLLLYCFEIYRFIWKADDLQISSPYRQSNGTPVNQNQFWNFAQSNSRTGSGAEATAAGCVVTVTQMLSIRTPYEFCRLLIFGAFYIGWMKTRCFFQFLYIRLTGVPQR